MTIALWIIAICEVGRFLQNFIQIRSIQNNTKDYNNACEEFIKSLNRTDVEILQAVLDEYSKCEGEKNEKADIFDGN